MFQNLENKSEPLAPLRVFFWRLARNFLITFGIVVFSLGFGTAGYCYFGNLSGIDGLYNATMILTGMGPVDKLETTAGKLFASFYALYSGVTFLTLVAVLMAPAYHRFIHHFHLVDEEEKENEK